MTNRLQIKTPLIVIAGAALLLAGCNRNDERTTGQRLDSAVATAERKTETAADSAARSVERAANAVEAKIDDAAITAGVNAELAKDSKLSALKINVDTTNGRVLLRGSAPDPISRDRATSLAARVKGVTTVENLLVVRG